MKNPKRKGNSFEAFVSKQLSLWWSKGTNTDYFYRSQSSGARFTVRKKMGENTYGQNGDITSCHPNSSVFSTLFVCECKSYKDINLWSLITDTKGTLTEWWVKLRKSISDSDFRYPILIVKENRKPELLICNEQFKNSFLSDIQFKLSGFIDGEQIFCYLFSDFLKLDWDKFKRTCDMIIEDGK